MQHSCDLLFNIILQWTHERCCSNSTTDAGAFLWYQFNWLTLSSIIPFRSWQPHKRIKFNRKKCGDNDLSVFVHFKYFRFNWTKMCAILWCSMRVYNLSPKKNTKNKRKFGIVWSTKRLCPFMDTRFHNDENRSISRHWLWSIISIYQLPVNSRCSIHLILENPILWVLKWTQSTEQCTASVIQNKETLRLALEIQIKWREVKKIYITETVQHHVAAVRINRTIH